MTEKSEQRRVLALCMLLTPLIGLGFDLYTPSLPAITHYFHISHFSANLTIILYIAGFGIAQPLVGIVSDHVKRKQFLITALTIYLLSATVSAWSPTITALYCYRIINSICASSIAVVIKSLLVDHFTGTKLAKANNYFTMSWSLTPMIAPVIGGYFQHYYDWQFNFYFMGLCALLGLILSLFLLKINPSSHHKKILTLRSIFEKWKILSSDKLFIASVLILSVENAILFIYYTVSPFIIQESLHYNAAQYGQIMLFAGLSYVIGNVINHRLLNYFDVKKIIHAGLVASLIIILLAILFMHSLHNAPMNIYIITIPIFILFMCDGLIFSNVATCILPRYTQFSGTAGGLLAGLLNIFAALIVAFSTHFFDLHDVSTLDWTYLILIVLSLFIFIFL